MNKFTSRLGRLVRSVVALILMMMLLIATTHSWLSQNFTSQVNSNDYITISADTGLEMNYGKDYESQGAVDINGLLGKSITLSECSSIDGRNLYFPLSDFSSQGDGEFTEDVDTQDLIFRESTGNDLNTKYISFNISLKSESDTPVWLSKTSYIRNSESEDPTSANAVRVAFVDNDVKNPKSYVFDNSTTKDYAEKNNAVKSIDSDGNAETSPCDTHSISEYIFGNSNDNQALFNLEANVPKIITVTIWLEGTDKDCTMDILDINNLNIYTKFTTSYEDVRTVYFVDNTLEKWIADDKCYLYAIDNTDGTRYPMTKDADYKNTYTWSVNLPESVDNVTFARYNPAEDSDWNIFSAGKIQSCTTYVAFGHNTGMWSDSFSGTTITLFDGTVNRYLDDESAVMHVAFTANDGNGAEQNFDYKLSHQSENYTWKIIIPSEATNITFMRYNSEETTIIGKGTWSNTERGDNLYYTITASGSGYWSSKLLYLEGKGYSTNCIFVAYFYNSETSGIQQWTSMCATSDSGRYIVAVPDGMNCVDFVRYNSNATEFKWDRSSSSKTVYNELKSSKHSFGDNNVFTITGYTGEYWVDGTKLDNYYMTGDWSYEENP